MRLGGWGIVLMAGTMTMCPVAAQTPFERAVLDALNAARGDPADYALGLRHYRTYFRAKMLHYPGQLEDIETTEGVAAVDDTIAFLGHQVPLDAIAEAAPLAAAAADHSADQAASGEVGHDGSDGSSPGDRMRAHGGGAYVAEVIAYGPIDAVDVVRQLVVDDGVPDRGHRDIIFSPELRFAGVACGPHPEYRTMCVIDLGATPDGREPGAGKRVTTR